MLTEQQKKYLITIYILGQNGGSVRTTDIAKYLHVAKASTVKMEKKLTDEGLIIKEPYRPITLTKKGINEANMLFTTSIILQDFFQSRVGLTAEKAGEAAMILCAELDEMTLDKIADFVLSGK
ncbi:metal-dependent transcriptional regulator [Ruminococcus sp. NK3A76]|uniref:metal-dependent transcriptional regulator n=1 Tax=Ruminococcus sp. NK3A76 TaxID=877411 RepID=UPI00048DD0E1|nr:metal-dependent transcriptional regulator [Ruminococcus sp. NK3A76]